MSFPVNFYKFNKKPNSTKQPNGLEPTVFNCDLWGSFDMAAPVLRVEAGMDIITKYTFVEIPLWGKLYFVETYGWSEGFVTVTLKPDPLGTYKHFINNREQFILRTNVTSRINPYITDTVYPADSNTIINTTNIGDFTNVNGIYVLEVAGAGGNVFYAMTRDNFTRLTNWFFSQPSDDFWKTIVVGTAQNVLGTFFDPISYIASAYYIPVINKFADTTTVTLGYWQTNIPAASVSPFAMADEGFFIFEIPYSTYRTDNTEYLSYEPYFSAKINLPFAGSFPLPSSTDRAHNINYRVDLKGNIFYEIRNSNGAIVLQTTGRLGYPIGIGKNTTNALDVVSNAISAGISGYNGDIGGATTGVINAVQASIPHNTFISRTHQGCADNSTISLTYECSRIGPGAPNLGYPCYRNYMLDTPGWYQCMDAQIDWIDEMYEFDLTKQYMDGGIWIE